MTNKLKWRLGKLPTSDEVRELVKADLITKEEAREIMFNEETDEDIKVDSLKEEIKFLRETIEKLADKKTITETIQVIIPKYITQPFYQPYYSWGYYGGASYCTSATLLGNCTSGSTNLVYGSGSTNSVNCSATGASSLVDSSFTDISTF